MKSFDNGVVREMTEEEIKELMAKVPEEVKETVEDRLEKLEKLFNRLTDFLGVK